MEAHTATAMLTARSKKQLSLHALHGYDRSEDRDRGQGRRKQRRCHFGRALQHGLFQRLAVLQQAHNVFLHDDGGIQHQAGRKRQTGQGNDIEAAAKQVEHQQGGQQRNRDGHGNQRGCTPTPKHQIEQSHGQPDAQTEIALYQSDGTLDVLRRIEAQDQLQVRVGQVGFVDLRDPFLQRGHDLNRVGIGGGEKLDVKGRVAVAVGESSERLMALSHRGDLAQTHHPTVVVGNDHLGPLIGHVLAGKSHGVLAPTDRGEATGNIARTAQALQQGVELYTKGRHAVGIEYDFDLRLAKAVETDFGYAPGMDRRLGATV